MIYLDANATTPVSPTVLEAMLPYLTEYFGNPSSASALGAKSKEAISKARGLVAELLHARPPEIIFTSGATESIHTVIYGAAASKKGAVVTSTVEHPSTMLLLRYLEEKGVRVIYVPVDGKGQLDSKALEKALAAEVSLLTLIWANHETGVLFPIDDIARLAHQKNIPFHVDATQAIGKIAIDLAQTPIDYLSFSGHKIHAPKGIGVLYVRKGASLPALIFGHQERQRRGGTENVAAIVGLGQAALEAQAHLQVMPHVARLRDMLEQGIMKMHEKIRVNGGGARVANTSNMLFPGFDAEMLLYRLEKAGIVASRGAACAAGGDEPSPVLLAMGKSRQEALSSLRFSLLSDASTTTIDAVLSVFSTLLLEELA
jgi:cysteine desulfurase